MKLSVEAWVFYASLTPKDHEHIERMINEISNMPFGSFCVHRNEKITFFDPKSPRIEAGVRNLITLSRRGDWGNPSMIGDETLSRGAPCESIDFPLLAFSIVRVIKPDDPDHAEHAKRFLTQE